MPLDYYVWVIKGGRAQHRRGHRLRRRRGRQPRTHAAAPGGRGAGRGRCRPADVQDVVITHMHYDHAGNMALFPRARFHVQDAEMAYCTGRAMTHRHLSAHFDAEDVVTMVRRVYDGRVVFHAGDSALCPGVTLHHLPGHTLGLQAVRVETARGPVVLASDAAHFWANLRARNSISDRCGRARLPRIAPQAAAAGAVARSHHPRARSCCAGALPGRGGGPGRRASRSARRCRGAAA